MFYFCIVMQWRNITIGQSLGLQGTFQEIVDREAQYQNSPTCPDQFCYYWTFALWVSNYVVTPTPLVLWGKQRLSAKSHNFLTFLFVYCNTTP